MKNLEKNARKKVAFHHQLRSATRRDQTVRCPPRLGGTSDARSAAAFGDFGGGLKADLGAAILFTGDFYRASPADPKPNDLWEVFCRVQLEF
jgi:hypothetical protein